MAALPSIAFLLSLVFVSGALGLAGVAEAQNDPYSYYVGSSGHNYRDALTKSLLFFEGQRSGKLPPNQRLRWRGDSGLSDGASENVDLTGGYYDAGDNVKFGLPMAFTTTMLSWSVLEFGGRMGTELPNAMEAIRWATDYLLKATAKPDVIYVQVGDPNSDHKCWQRPEDMTTPRTVYKIDAQNPGSDVAAETAAALAAASLVFRVSDKPYSRRLLGTAKRVFEFANKYRGAYSDSLKGSVCPFYCSYSGFNDELLWGAAWLHRATRDPTYTTFIQSNSQTLGAYDDSSTFSWDDKHAGVKVLLAKEVLLTNSKTLTEFRDRADNFICSTMPGTSGSQYTPGGLLFKLPDANLQYVTTSTFLLLTYAKYLSVSHQEVRCGGQLITPARIRGLAKKQVDYILGSNPMGMSYMVGYGTKYPQRVHHRGASMPSIFQHKSEISCDEGFQYFYSGSPNPNILVGAVVGGPNNNDQFPDQRNDYSHSEPTTYINAPLVGSLAYFAHAIGQ